MERDGARSGGGDRFGCAGFGVERGAAGVACWASGPCRLRCGHALHFHSTCRLLSFSLSGVRAQESDLHGSRQILLGLVG